MAVRAFVGGDREQDKVMILPANEIVTVDTGRRGVASSEGEIRPIVIELVQHKGLHAVTSLTFARKASVGCGPPLRIVDRAVATDTAVGERTITNRGTFSRWKERFFRLMALVTGGVDVLARHLETQIVTVPEGDSRSCEAIRAVAGAAALFELSQVNVVVARLAFLRQGPVPDRFGKSLRKSTLL